MRIIRTILIFGLLITAASAMLITVESSPTISLSGTGSSISFTGAGFLPVDTTCSVSSPSSSSVILSSACVIQAGTGMPHGGFMLGNVLPGEYVIQVTGNEGDFAQAVLAVD
jgi:hypothetical protein